MKIKNGVVCFKSYNRMFLKEKSGRKNNTVRILSANEYSALQGTTISEIEIINADTGEVILRQLSDISDIGSLLGSYVVVFTWRTKNE